MAEIRHSVCALDCPDCCSLLVTVENGRGTRLRGDPRHPVTRGFLCGKVAQYLEREYHPARLMHPMKRAGRKGEGRFERIGWDEALDTIAARLKSIAAGFGPESVLPYSYAGTMGVLNFGGMDRRFFHRLGASRLDRTICSTAGMAGMTNRRTALMWALGWWFFRRMLRRRASLAVAGVAAGASQRRRGIGAVVGAILLVGALAGAFVAWVIDSGAVVEEEGDADEMFANLAAVADPTDEWWRPEAHGSVERRQAAFAAGVDGGVAAC